LEVLGVNTRFGPQHQSIFFGQQNTRRRAIGFGNHPNLGSALEGVRRQQLPAMFEAEFVFLSVLGIYVTPVTRKVPSEVIKKRFARYPIAARAPGVATK